MAAVMVLLVAGLAVVATITRRYLPSKKIKAWLCSVLHGAAAAAGVEDEERVVAVELGREEVEGVFATFDKDGDGFITAAELEESLRKLRLPVTRAEVAAMVERLDANGDGLLDLEEFWELYRSVVARVAAAGGGRGVAVEKGAGDQDSEVYDERELKEAFDVFDGNGDGLISGEELGLVLAALGLAPVATAARCCDMIKRVDLDGDGKVSFEEFKRMMTGSKDRKLF